MTYMKNGMIYHVNFDQRRIVRMENMGADMAMLMGGGQNMKQFGKELMKKMGGKKPVQTKYWVIPVMFGILWEQSSVYTRGFLFV